jgi:hypothetical protein
MRRIIFLIEQPFDDRNYERFGIQTWLRRDWAVEVWDLTPWAHPDVWREFVGYGKQIRRFAGYFPIASARELAARIAESRPIRYFIDLTAENYYATRAKLLLMRTGATRVACAVGSIPVPDRDGMTSLLGRMARVLARGPRGAWRWLSHAFFHKVVARHVTSDWTIVGGQRSIDLARHSRRMIRAHNFDYDIYLELLKSTGTAAGRYAVFIDQDYCFHPEYVYQNIVPLITPERYFPAVCKALTAISAALELDVRVAAHPRSTYEERGLDCFAAFPIEYGRTGELVRGCSLVVCHDSTAIQFAVLFGKPVIFLTTDELIRSPEGRSIAKAAAELGKAPINLDREELRAVDWQKELCVDAEKYDSYIRRYIKAHGSRQLPVWEIVIDELETAESEASCC